MVQQFPREFQFHEQHLVRLYDKAITGVHPCSSPEKTVRDDSPYRSSIYSPDQDNTFLKIESKSISMWNSLLHRYNSYRTLRDANAILMKSAGVLTLRGLRLPCVINLREKMFSRIDLSGNLLSSFESLFAQTSLRSLSLQSNNLSSLPPQTWPSIAQLMPNLAILNLSQNNLVVIHPNLCSLTSLQSLFLESNLLMSLPTRFAQLTGLKELSLARNTVSPADIREVISLGLTSLTRIDLSSNNLIDVSFVSKLVHLNVLQLQENGIQVLPSLEALEGLEIVDLRGNLLSDLPSLPSNSAFAFFFFFFSRSNLRSSFAETSQFGQELFRRNPSSDLLVLHSSSAQHRAQSNQQIVAVHLRSLRAENASHWLQSDRFASAQHPRAHQSSSARC
jgi:Leucine-rich repeat (LRR) protein